MKSQLNAAWLPGDKEVDLFRKMGTILSSLYKVSFIQEVHQRRIRFKSMAVAVEARREIADLWIIAYSPKRKKAKMTFLQAKYHKTHLGHPGVFSAEFFQYELLSKRLLLTRGGKLDLPSEILASSCCDSVGSYGVFYLDASKNLDMAYSSANELISLSPPPKTYGQHHIDLQFPSKVQSVGQCNSCFSCTERNFTLEIDIFTQSLLDLEIGADIYHNDEILDFIRSVIVKKAATDPTVLDFAEFVSDVPPTASGDGGTDNPDGGGLPAHLLLINVDGIEKPGKIEHEIIPER